MSPLRRLIQLNGENSGRIVFFVEEKRCRHFPLTDEVQMLRSGLPGASPSVPGGLAVDDVGGGGDLGGLGPVGLRRSRGHGGQQGLGDGPGDHVVGRPAGLVRGGGQWPPLEPDVLRGGGRRGPLGGRRRGELTQGRGQGEGLVSVRSQDLGGGGGSGDLIAAEPFPTSTIPDLWVAPPTGAAGDCR